MSDSVTIQIVIYAALALVLVVAIAWGAKRVKLKLPGIEASVDPDEKRTVSVAERMTIERAEVGNVTGERRADAAGPAARDVRVLNDATIRDGKIGDITGVVETRSDGEKT